MSPSIQIMTGGHVATTKMRAAWYESGNGLVGRKIEIRRVRELNASGFEELSHVAEFFVAAIKEITCGEP